MPRRVVFVFFFGDNFGWQHICSRLLKTPQFVRWFCFDGGGRGFVFGYFQGLGDFCVD